ncbi:hypothetical protein HBB16_15700 [Pseudonocardia sp. MCCB 268]|nr:hypothetical protein [Pseudonocardia cytotoxica]
MAFDLVPIWARSSRHARGPGRDLPAVALDLRSPQNLLLPTEDPDGRLRQAASPRSPRRRTPTPPRHLRERLRSGIRSTVPRRTAATPCWSSATSPAPQPCSASTTRQAEPGQDTRWYRASKKQNRP